MPTASHMILVASWHSSKPLIFAMFFDIAVEVMQSERIALQFGNGMRAIASDG